MAVTVEQVTRTLRASLPSLPTNTLDGFHHVYPDEELRKIGVCMQATLAVVDQAVSRDIQLLITHEPTFFNAPADDELVQAKLASLQQSRLSIWRCHDAWHKRNPDGIAEGFARQMGWMSHRADDTMTNFELPQTSLRALAEQLQSQLQLPGLRLVGRPEGPVRRVSVCCGSPSRDLQRSFLQKPGLDVLVCGEAREWEAYEYARDAVHLRGRPALIVVGHVASEEPGMRLLRDHLQGLISIPVEYIVSDSPY